MKDVAKFTGVVALYALIILATACVQVWLVMLAIGALHHAAHAVPSLSYCGSSWLVVLAYLMVWPAVASGKRTEN
ncbi:hypothetical protein [Streptomyces sp. NRRL S-31]|uniref:hypothetical protein n=1 Tax=Streptomyces sp. NRRL S-31 TaxID=1463898 RepID=UPI0004CB0CAD|nr:hypothetical protein [Streptomyces sp. NRRL S-31]